MLQSQKKSVSNNNNTLFHYFPTAIQNDLKAAAGLALILIVFRFQAFININQYYLGSVQGDAGLYLWLMKTNFYDLFHLPWFEKNAFYPYSNVLGWSDNFILPSLFAKILFTAGFSDALIFNATILLSTFLNGYLTYLTSVRLSGEKFASFFAGSCFMSLPYFTHQLGHPQLQFFFFIPLGVLLFVRFTNKQTYLNSFYLCINILAAFLTTVTYSIFLTLIYLILFFSLKLLRPSVSMVSFVKKLFPGALPTLLLMLPFILPYLSVQEAFGERHVYEAYYFAADIFSYFSSTPYNLLYDASKVLSQSEAHLFPGLTLLLLTTFGISRIGEARTLKYSLMLNFSCLMISIILTLFPTYLNIRPLSSIPLWCSMLHGFFILSKLGKLEKKLNVTAITARDLIAIFAITGLIFFIISLGPLGNPEKKQLAIAPFSFFYTIIPGFSSIRAISRAGTVVLFCASVISGLYFSVLFKKKALRGLAVLAFTILLIENYTSQFPLSALPSAPDNFKNYSENMGVAAALPITGKLDSNGEVESWSEYAKINMTYLLWSNNRSSLLNGYSGQKTKIMRSFPRELKDFPSKRAINALSSIAGLNYIIYSPEMNPDFNSGQFEEAISNFSLQLRLVSKDRQGTYLFKFTPEVQTSKNNPIWLPGGAASVLNLETRTLFRFEKDKITLRAYLNQDFSRPFMSQEINSDGSWNKIEIKVPPSPNKTKPNLIYLLNEDDSGVIVKNMSLK